MLHVSPLGRRTRSECRPDTQIWLHGQQVPDVLLDEQIELADRTARYHDDVVRQQCKVLHVVVRILRHGVAHLDKGAVGLAAGVAPEAMSATLPSGTSQRPAGRGSEKLSKPLTISTGTTRSSDGSRSGA